jgi:hypothetical protein
VSHLVPNRHRAQLVAVESLKNIYRQQMRNRNGLAFNTNKFIASIFTTELVPVAQDGSQFAVNGPGPADDLHLYGRLGVALREEDGLPL